MRRAKIWIAVIVGLAALWVWIPQLKLSRSPTPAQLQDTNGVSVRVVKSVQAENGFIITCEVSNARSAMAEQVVLNVFLSDAAGLTLAANPLVSVPRLNPQETRELQVFVPFRGTHERVFPGATVSLVRSETP